MWNGIRNMKIYLASTHEGLTVKAREHFIQVGKPKYILETFFNGEKKCVNALKNVEKENFLLDSGAFSFMNGQECSKNQILEYTERYIQLINKYKIENYFELDVDTIFGIDFVEEIRKKLEKETNRECIPVWHKSRGIDYYKKMVERYKYIAIGGLVFHVKKQELSAIKKMVTYAKQKGVKVHGLGFAKTRELPEWDWWSVDSSSWTKAAGRGQQRHIFNGKYIEAHRIENEGKKIMLSDLAAANGIEWCKYQRYMEDI